MHFFTLFENLVKIKVFERFRAIFHISSKYKNLEFNSFEVEKYVTKVVENGLSNHFQQLLLHTFPPQMN